MKLPCPNCTQSTLSIFKVFIADIFGWAVRCGNCKKRVSHSGLIRGALRVVAVIGSFLVVAVTVYPDQRFHAVNFVACLGILIVVLTGIVLHFALFKREDVVRDQTLHELRRILKILLIVYGIVVLSKICFFYTNMLETVGFALYIAFVFVVLSLPLLFAANWTLDE